jgi:hypothetical protein
MVELAGFTLATSGCLQSASPTAAAEGRGTGSTLSKPAGSPARSPSTCSEMKRQGQGHNDALLCEAKVRGGGEARKGAFALTASARAVRGVSSAGFTTAEQPAASAGPTLRVIIAAGKFQGVMSAATPTGCFTTSSLRPPTVSGMVLP